jgi:abortive infection bacteriophage resistance protein
MLFGKPATPITEQVALLKARGMTISNVNLATRWLETVGYYRLSAYWLPYESLPPVGQTRSKKFPPGVRFEEVIDLYIFDRRLRLLVTEAIERLEVAVRARWTNRLALAHGPHAHMDARLFLSGWDHARMVSKLSDAAHKSREVFVEHYRSKYSEPYMPPLWAVTELMTLGELSLWVKSTKDASLRSSVAKDLGLPTAETLTGALEVFSLVRNICAHHGRLWNRKTVKRLPTIKRFSAVLVPEAGGHQLSNRIFNVLTLLVLLMRHQSNEATFPKRLKKLLESREKKQLDAMGFPADWRRLAAWA